MRYNEIVEGTLVRIMGIGVVPDGTIAEIISKNPESGDVRVGYKCPFDTAISSYYTVEVSCSEIYPLKKRWLYQTTTGIVVTAATMVGIVELGVDIYHYLNGTISGYATIIESLYTTVALLCFVWAIFIVKDVSDRRLLRVQKFIYGNLDRLTPEERKKDS